MIYRLRIAGTKRWSLARRHTPYAQLEVEKFAAKKKLESGDEVEVEDHGTWSITAEEKTIYHAGRVQFNAKKI